MEGRLSVIWFGLFGVLQSTDVLTTAVDRARGSIESMPVSAALLDAGGVRLYLLMKVFLIAAAALALLLSVRWVRAKRRNAQAVHLYVLSAVRIGTVAIALASLNNAVLLRSMG
ncbi:MAG TPA: hypothetical protein VFR33_10725 [Candidatus Dormibacteraeota bacterium]|nr:hypothetical protein [Candidatus Dormibacteraeota bacterium]